MLARTILRTTILCLAFASVSSPATADPFASTFHELAPGVWALVRDDSPRIPVMGTTTFAISDDGVVVFDGGGLPAMSDLVIEKIRALTNAPVTHVVVSHWHGDHNMGIFRFAEEFPNVQHISHEFTRAAMVGRPMDYVKRFPERVPQLVEILSKQIAEGNDGTPLSPVRADWYQQFIDDADAVDVEYKRAKLTVPSVTFEERLVLHSGARTIELLYLGDANTAGDIVMWLPAERIVAAGDMVVLPTPYGFNVPPRAWAATMRNLQALEYATLVPGHGAIQTTRTYVDLLIETAVSIADQRDAMIAEGKTHDEIKEALDFSAVEDRFTRGDPFLKDRFDDWFSGPFRAAAIKALSGEPMVTLERKEED